MGRWIHHALPTRVGMAARHTITDNADRQLATMSVPVPLSGEPGECAMFDAERFELLLDKGCIAFRKVFDEGAGL